MDPAKMKVVDLRSELGALGLDTKGNKPALVERLKKALEAKTGKVIADTTILDTSTEDTDEGTPRRAGPAARTRRRSSSSRLISTPAKQPRHDSPETIKEEKQQEDRYSPGQDSDEKDSSPAKADSPEKSPSPSPPAQPEAPKSNDEEAVSVEERSQSPVVATGDETDDEESESKDEPEKSKDDSEKPAVEKMDQDGEEVKPKKEVDGENKEGDKEADGEKKKSLNGWTKELEDLRRAARKSHNRAMNTRKDVDWNKYKQKQAAFKKKTRQLKRGALHKFTSDTKQYEMTEEEEWDLLNERLQQREQERLEREKKQAEEDAKRLEELSNDPVKLNRLKRKHEKKARWSNFYRSVEVTNEVLTPPNEEEYLQKKAGSKQGKDAAELKAPEPEIDENKITLSWYDSDLNQYITLPGLNEVIPLSEGAFAHAWAGVRATHGVQSGRVCYEVRVGAIAATTETTEKSEPIMSGLRIGWSTINDSLHLGSNELSWGYESTGRAVNNGEFKEYGKTLTEKDVVGAYLDLESNPCKISYTVNGVEQGAAFEFEKSKLNGKAVFPHILTKNVCYKINFGYDKYNMLTKTKIVRNRIEIPVEKVIEEKRAIEAELKRQKEEAEKKEKERKEKEKQEREERQRKKREEREKVERERKEKEAQDRRDRGEPEPEEKKEEKAEEKEKEKEKDKDKVEDKPGDEPKENGEKRDETAAPSADVEVKAEPMETDQPAPTTDKKDVKQEPDGDCVEVTEEQAMTKGYVLDKRIKFVIRFTVDEELDGTEACLLPGYVFISHADLVEGVRPPATNAECEVILMVGMPGAGKTYWARKQATEHPERRYNILSTSTLLDNMQVDCKPFRASHEGRWEAMVSKCAKCVLKLVELARGRRRNYILDQTNVYPSAQRRKLREFEGYKRLACVVVPSADEYRARLEARPNDDKLVPDPALQDMKANFSLPEKCSFVDEVIYPELGEDEAKKVIDEFHKEARAAGVTRARRSRSPSDRHDDRPGDRSGPGDKRRGGDDRRHDRSRDRDREDRWGIGGGGGGGGGSRWGGGGGGGPRGGSRWGGRDNRTPSSGRMDRQWGGPPRGGGDFGRDRDGFRGGRGGGGGGRGDRGGRPGGDPGRFSRDNRGPRDNRDKRPPGGPNPIGNTGGAGSWQRGGQVANRGGGGGGGGSGGGGGGGALRNNPPNRPGNKDGGNQNAGQNQQWNQWAGGWGGWGNWNQNPAAAANWGQWGNWGNWNNGGQQAGAGAGGTGSGGQGGQQAGGKQAQQQQQQAQQWGGNYTAQQWYQWQQWQQQQQQWAGYQQGQQGQQQAGGNTQDAQQAWAQYYQNYNAANSALTGAADKK